MHVQRSEGEYKTHFLKKLYKAKKKKKFLHLICRVVYELKTKAQNSEVSFGVPFSSFEHITYSIC